GLPCSDDISEPKCAPGQVEHKTIRRYKRFASQFTGPVGRYRRQRGMIFICLDLSEIAIYSASRSVKYSTYAGASHRLQNVICEQGALIKIDLRLGCCACDIGIGCQVNDDIMARHGSL